MTHALTAIGAFSALTTTAIVLWALIQWARDQ